MKIAYVGNFSQPFCTEVHISQTLENMGHEVTRIQETPKRSAPNWVFQVRGHDMFLYQRTWGEMVIQEDLRKIKDWGIPSVSYHLDLYVGLQREAGLKDDPFWHTEYVFTPDGSEQAAEVFKKYGINHHYVKPAVFKGECEMLPKDNSDLQGDVVFVGNGKTYGHPEWPYRKQLVEFLEDTYGDRYKKYGHPERVVRNRDLNQLYANAKVVVGDSLCLGFDHPYYWSDRVYETIGRGGFIIHPYIKGMEEEFTDGENIVFYEFNNWEQLKEKIDYYLVNDSERDRIRRNGFEFVKENATYENRLEEVFRVVFSTPHLTKEEEQEIASTINNSSYLRPVATKINLGAGNDQKEGFLNVDLVPLPGIDVVHNLMKFPYPFDSNSADEIHAIDVVEHLDNYTEDYRPTVVAFVEECYRILRPGGVLYIQTPGWKADFLWIDPTHVRGFDISSFDFFDPTTPYGQKSGYYSKTNFSVKKEELPNHNLRFWLTKV